LVVFSLPLDQSRAIVEGMKLPYPLYSDPDWTVFETYGTGHILFGPKQAWFGIDGDGTIRYTWRSGQNGKTGRVPLPLEALAEFERALK
jgi:peroxiredoxin